VSNYTDYDLDRVIRRYLPFSEAHIRLVIYQILRGLKVEIYSKCLLNRMLLSFILIQFIHSAGVIHCVSQNAEIFTY